MNNNHPDEITLLRLAFPQEDHPVDEHWAWHVLLCKQCSEHILTMRKMRELQATTSAAQMAPPTPSAYSPPKSFKRAVAASVALSAAGGGTALNVAQTASDADSPLAAVPFFDDMNEISLEATAELESTLACGSDFDSSLTSLSMVDNVLAIETDWGTTMPEILTEPSQLLDFDDMTDGLS